MTLRQAKKIILAVRDLDRNWGGKGGTIKKAGRTLGKKHGVCLYRKRWDKMMRKKWGL